MDSIDNTAVFSGILFVLGMKHGVVFALPMVALVSLLNILNLEKRWTMLCLGVGCIGVMLLVRTKNLFFHFELPAWAWGLAICVDMVIGSIAATFVIRAVRY